MSTIPKTVPTTDTSNYPYAYKSAGDVIEGINRALAYSHFNMLYDVSNTMSNESSYGYHLVNLSSSYIDTNTYNTIAFNSYTPNSFESRVCGVRLMLQMSITTPGVPFSVILGNANNECLVVSTSTNQPEYKQINNICYFAEYGFNSIYKGANVNYNGVSNVFYPQESFLTFSNAGSGGAWYISVVNTSNSTVAKRITGNIVARLEVFELANIPSTPPVFGITSANKLELLYQQHYPVNNIKILVTPKLYRMLSFTGQSGIFNNKFDAFELIWPNFPLTHPLYSSIVSNSAQKTVNGYSTLVFTQFSSTVYRLNNVTNILVMAQALGKAGEYFNDYYQQQVVQDFIVNTENDMGDLIFSTDASILPYRRYRLQSDTSLNQLSFSIYVKYKDGSIARVTMPPGTQYSMKIGFFKRDSN